MRRFPGSRSHEPEGPRPFSSGWLEVPAPPASPRSGFRLPAWIPDGRALSAAMVVVVSLAIAFVTIQQGQGSLVNEATQTPSAQTPIPPTEAPVVAGLDATLVVADGDVLETPALQTPAAVGENLQNDAFVQAPQMPTSEAAAVASAPFDTALLPEYRIVAYYGHPHDPNMGIVGEVAKEELANQVKTLAADYAAADPSRPVIPAFELIATVAQRVPGSDGSYILDTDHETLTEYIDYAEAQGMIVLLDLQVGRGTVANEIEKVRDLLARPNVHLALDPEFAVAEGQIPGVYIGSLPAESIAYAQQVLAEISAEQGVPPKILVVHQFREDMIQGKELLEPVPGVQLVIDADGYGAPELKTAVYNFLVRDEPVEYAGVKLFFRQDKPMMSPREILELVPAPDVIIYQ